MKRKLKLRPKTSVFREVCWTRHSIIIAAVIVIGLATLLISRAATPTNSFEAENGTKSGNLGVFTDGGASGGSYVRFGAGPTATCGAEVSNYTYVRPFGPNAAWNTPACLEPKWSRSDDFVNRLANYAIQTTLGYYMNNGVSTHMTQLDFGTEFGLITTTADQGNDYSLPVYDATTATQHVRIRLKKNYAGYNANIGGPWIGSPSYDWNATVPWNPAWRPAYGQDQGMVIINPTTGQEWYLWNVSRADMPSPFNNTSSCLTDLSNLVIGYDQYSDLCVAAANISKTYAFQDTNYHTYEGNFPAASGGGLQNYAGLTTPDEVAAGEIRHALKFTITNSGFGPICSSNLSIDDPSIETSCGIAVAPAGQFENGGNTTGIFGGRQIAPGGSALEIRSNTIPEGTRFALNITDPEINTWLDNRGYHCTNPVTDAQSCRKRETARIFAVAMRDYGLIVTDTSAGGSSIQVSGGMNPDTAQKWRNLGIDDNGKSFLYQLFTQDKLYAVVPATNDCGNGTVSRYYCHADKTHY